MAEPYRVGERTSATISSISLPEHKEDQLCRDLAKRFSVELGCTASVSGGIHFDGIDAETINEVCDNVKSMADYVIFQLKNDSEKGRS